MTPEDLLEQCLKDSQAGQTPAQSAVAHPGFPDLAALLAAADALRTWQKPGPSPEADRRIEAQLRRQLRSAHVAHRAAPARLMLRWLAPVLVAGALFLSSLGVSVASASSLPGDALYPAKRATETVQLALTPAGSRAGLHARFAQRRLDEVQALAQRGVFDAQLLNDLSTETEAALNAVDDAPANQQTQVLDDILALAEHQQAVLQSVMAAAPAPAQAGLQRALEASSQHYERARQHPARGGQPAGGETVTPVEGQTASPSQVPPGQAKKTEAAATAGALATPGEIVTPGEGPTSQPSQVPPGQAKKTEAAATAAALATPTGPVCKPNKPGASANCTATPPRKPTVTVTGTPCPTNPAGRPKCKP